MLIQGSSDEAVMSERAKVSEQVASRISDLDCWNGETVMPAGRRPVKSYVFQHGMCASHIKSSLNDVVQGRMTCNLPALYRHRRGCKIWRPRLIATPIDRESLSR